MKFQHENEKNARNISGVRRYLKKSKMRVKCALKNLMPSKMKAIENLRKSNCWISSTKMKKYQKYLGCMGISQKVKNALLMCIEKPHAFQMKAIEQLRKSNYWISTFQHENEKNTRVVTRLFKPIQVLKASRKMD